MGAKMSAIVGLHYKDEQPAVLDYGNKMMESLRSFPAHDVQAFYRRRIFLGCHAHWLTPESIGSKQPFYNTERQLVVTADAIIDNRDDLFRLLDVHRELHDMMTDSELILRAYDKWGEQCPQYLIGDFAFIIWDERRQVMFGARDFSGSRTLYYYMDEHKLALCTTIEPLFVFPDVAKRTINEQWIAEYLAIPGNNEAVDMGITVYKDIAQLPPAHSFIYKDHRLTLTRYRTISVEQPLRLKSNDDYVEAFQDVFEEAIKARMRTHRPIGSHLSGGLDSGAVSVFAAKLLAANNEQLHTFSYVPADDFNDWAPRYRVANERPYIEATVKQTDNINAHYVDGSIGHALHEVDEWLDIMEMPYKFFGTSVWIKSIYERAHQYNVGILLNGGRGNITISWGPALNYYALILKRLKWLKLNQELLQYCKNVGRSSRKQVMPVIARIAFPQIARRFVSDEAYRFPTLINDDLAKRTGVFEKLLQHGIDAKGSFLFDNAYEARARHFQELYPWNATSTAVTKLSLRYPLWKRDPTNDLRVVQFCLSVPEEQYVQNGMDRSLIRRATKGLLPDKVRLNQSNKGIQGVDCVHRMAPHWHELIAELEKATQDSHMQQWIDVMKLKQAIALLKGGPKHELSLEHEYTLAMRSLIIYRFITNKGR